MKSAIRNLFQTATQKLAIKDHRAAIRDLSLPAMGMAGIPSSEDMSTLIALRTEHLDLCGKLGLPEGAPPKLAGKSAAEIKAQVAAYHIGNAEMHKTLNDGAKPVPVKLTKIPAKPTATVTTPARPAIHSPMPSAASLAAELFRLEQAKATAPMSRAEFGKLTPAAKLDFVKAGRTLTN